MVNHLPDSQEELLFSSMRGNRQSQERLYRQYYGFAMGVCLRYTQNREEALEIVNDSFLKVFTHIDRYDASKPFKAWIARIITNTAIDHYRMNLKFSDHDDINTYTHLGKGAIVYEQLAYKDLLELVRGLSPAYRTVFNLYAIDGYTHEEIAALLNISVGTSKSNLFKARQKLQEKLAAEEKDQNKVVGINEKYINTDERRA